MKLGSKSLFLFLIFAFVFITSNDYEDTEGRGLGPGSSSLQMASSFLKISQDVVQQTNDALKSVAEISKSTVKVFGAISKGLAALGPVFMCVSAVLSIASLFVPKAESEMLVRIREGFDQANNKVDAIFTSIEEISIIAQLSSAKAKIVTHLDRIKALETELKITRHLGTKKAWEHFIEIYREQYKHDAEHFYQMLIGPKGVGDFGIDFLDIFRQKMECIPKSIAKLCIVAMQTINKGMDVEASYLGAIKYTSRIRIFRVIWERRMAKLRGRCLDILKYCEDNSFRFGRSVYDGFYSKHALNMDNRNFANNVAEILMASYPSLKWGVYMATDIGESNFQLQAKMSSYITSYKKKDNGKISYLVSAEADFYCAKTSEEILNKLGKDIKESWRCALHAQGPYFHGTSSYNVGLMTKTSEGAAFGGPTHADQHMYGTEVYTRDYPPGICVLEAHSYFLFC